MLTSLRHLRPINIPGEFRRLRMAHKRPDARFSVTYEHAPHAELDPVKLKEMAARFLGKSEVTLELLSELVRKLVEWRDRDRQYEEEKLLAMSDSIREANRVREDAEFEKARRRGEVSADPESADPDYESWSEFKSSPQQSSDGESSNDSLRILTEEHWRKLNDMIQLIKDKNSGRALSKGERETLVSEIESLNNETDLSELAKILVDLDPDEFLKCYSLVAPHSAKRARSHLE